MYLSMAGTDGIDGIWGLFPCSMLARMGTLNLNNVFELAVFFACQMKEDRDLDLDLEIVPR